MYRSHRFTLLLWSVLLCMICLCACGGEPAEDSPGAPEPPVTEQAPEVSAPEEAPQEKPVKVEDAVYSVSFGEYIVEYALPAGWESLYTTQVHVGEDGCFEVGFYHKASAEFGGWLFSLALFADEEYRQFPETTVVTKDEDVTLVCMRPSDVQFDLDYAAEYLAMSEEVNDILTTVTLVRADGEMGETS